MKKIAKHTASTSLYLRTPCNLDMMLETIARIERRTKTAVMSLCLEEYAEKHHQGLLLQYRGSQSEGGVMGDADRNQ